MRLIIKQNESFMFRHNKDLSLVGRAVTSLRGAWRRSSNTAAATTPHQVRGMAGDREASPPLNLPSLQVVSWSKSLEKRPCTSISIVSPMSVSLRVNNVLDPGALTDVSVRAVSSSSTFKDSNDASDFFKRAIKLNCRVGDDDGRVSVVASKQSPFPTLPGAAADAHVLEEIPSSPETTKAAATASSETETATEEQTDHLIDSLARAFAKVCDSVVLDKSPALTSRTTPSSSATAATGGEGGAPTKTRDEPFVPKFIHFYTKQANEADTQDIPFALEVQIPPNVNVNVRAQGTAAIAIEDRLTGGSLSVQSELGPVMLKNGFEGSSVELSSLSGDISVAKPLIGNTHISTVNGNVSVTRVQSETAHILSQNGSLTASDIYVSDCASLTAHKGISVGSVHGNVHCVSNKGKVQVGSVSDNLTVFSGGESIAVQLSSAPFGRVSIVSSGRTPVILGAPHECNATVSLLARHIRVDPALNISSVGPASLSAQSEVPSPEIYRLNDGKKGRVEVNTSGSLYMLHREWGVPSAAGDVHMRQFNDCYKALPVRHVTKDSSSN